jgi:hypothetical protein
MRSVEEGFEPSISMLMLTGVTTLAEVEALPVDQRPTAIAADAAELAGILDRLGLSPPARS